MPGLRVYSRTLGHHGVLSRGWLGETHPQEPSGRLERDLPSARTRRRRWWVPHIGHASMMGRVLVSGTEFMSFGEAIQTVFRKYAEFMGRAARDEFWWWALFNVLVAGVLNLFDVIRIGDNAYLG